MMDREFVFFDFGVFGWGSSTVGETVRVLGFLEGGLRWLKAQLRESLPVGRCTRIPPGSRWGKHSVSGSVHLAASSCTPLNLLHSSFRV